MVMSVQATPHVALASGRRTVAEQIQVSERAAKTGEDSGEILTPDSPKTAVK